MPRRRVVVTGMGIITGHGAGKEVNWARTVAGNSSVKEVTSFDASAYRGRSGAEARDFDRADIRSLNKRRLDRATHLLVGAVGEAISDAGLSASIMQKPVLFLAGTTLGGMLSGEAFHREVIEKGLKRARVSLVSDYLAHHQVINVFKEFGLMGDFNVFSNACASGTNAIGNAFFSLGRGEYDIALCGGYDTMSEFTFAGFNSLMAVSPTLCRPFDRNRDGLVLGEGAGIMVIEGLESAIGRGARIYCEVAGYGESSDAYHMTSPEPSGKSAAAAIRIALAMAGIPKVDYINAHGTGTKYNDAMEARAIIEALGDEGKRAPVSSIKPAVGHMLGGAGAVEAIVSALSIVHKTLPPNLNYETPDPECDLNIVREAAGCDIRTALSNSFGFGGSNASIVFKDYPWGG